MTAKTTSSRKQKGMNFEKEIISAIKQVFPELTDNDIRPVPSSVPGNDIWMSEKATEMLGIDIEAKFQETTKIWEWIKQADDRDKKRMEKGKDKLMPTVIFRRSRSKPYVCIRLEDFIQLLRSRR